MMNQLITTDQVLSEINYNFYYNSNNNKQAFVFKRFPINATFFFSEISFKQQMFLLFFSNE